MNGFAIFCCQLATVLCTGDLCSYIHQEPCLPNVLFVGKSSHRTIHRTKESVARRNLAPSSLLYHNPPSEDDVINSLAVICTKM
uniref:Putative secreted protein n=1 Tax=Anopheles darlingi TaxID=43151 RepID=A0A2M4D3C2_ANODA